MLSSFVWSRRAIPSAARRRSLRVVDPAVERPWRESRRFAVEPEPGSVAVHAPVLSSRRREVLALVGVPGGPRLVDVHPEPWRVGHAQVAVFEPGPPRQHLVDRVGMAHPLL